MFLTIGRMFVAFITSKDEIDKVQTVANNTFTEAVGNGDFAFLDTAPIVGTDALPIHVPTRNVCPSMNTGTVVLVKSDQTGSTVEHHRVVTVNMACCGFL